MQIIELPDTPITVSGAIVPVATQQELTDRRAGEDPPGLLRIWSVKPKFAAGGARSCAGLLIVDQLIGEGWGAVGVRVRGRGTAVGLVPDARLSDPGRCGRAAAGRGGRAAAGRQWRQAARVRRCGRLAGARPGPPRRGQGRPGPPCARPSAGSWHGAVLPPARRLGHHQGPGPRSGPPLPSGPGWPQPPCPKAAT
jgi:hypothetical protein